MKGSGQSEEGRIILLSVVTGGKTLAGSRIRAAARKIINPIAMRERIFFINKTVS